MFIDFYKELFRRSTPIVSYQCVLVFIYCWIIYRKILPCSKYFCLQLDFHVFVRINFIWIIFPLSVKWLGSVMISCTMVSLYSLDTMSPFPSITLTIIENKISLYIKLFMIFSFQVLLQILIGWWLIHLKPH